MAQRDYVKKTTKKKNKSKSRNVTKSKSNNKSRTMPTIMVLLAITLVVLFAAILYVVSTNKKDAKPVPPVKNITEGPQSTLPEKPEERWTYLKELEKTDTNQLPINRQPITHQQNLERQQILNDFINDSSQLSSNSLSSNNTTTDDWYLQCGAFKEHANAESAKAKLAMLGFNASIVNDKLYRVFVDERFASKIEAENAKKRLESNGILDCILSQK
ncbi:cell division protein FtsN [Frischella perrara]|uniref:Cell division protein n=1 Tax=Frischella perrara TaxID=1267021 RepID=A0A0A7S9Q2_FRIPE|nr:SPOR domain-containing protein [Frischella perrara]AJA46056.1 Cell division protein [Frischella perrara]PWV61307.1 cell division protein FtsN [Frischella perrara]